MSNYDACLVGNGALAPVASALKFFHPKKRFFSVVHGLDLTFAYKKGILPKIYKNINIPDRYFHSRPAGGILASQAGKK